MVETHRITLFLAVVLVVLVLVLVLVAFHQVVVVSSPFRVAVLLVAVLRVAVLLVAVLRLVMILVYRESENHLNWHKRIDSDVSHLMYQRWLYQAQLHHLLQQRLQLQCNTSTLPLTQKMADTTVL